MSEQDKLFEEDKIRVCNSLALSEANPLTFKVITLVEKHCSKLQVVGSIRRQRRVVRDLDFVAIATDRGWRNIIKSLQSMLDAKKKIAGSQILRLFVPFARGHIQVDFYRSTPKTWGIHELIRTGSTEHNIWLARYALRNRMHLEYSVGLTDNSGTVIASETEDEIFKTLGLEYITPAEREMKGGKPIWKKS